MVTGKTIKNIIFDLGIVIINVDTQRAVEAFKKMGVENIDEIYSRSSHKGFFDYFETGSISSEEFRNELKKYIPNKANSHDIDTAWNAMLLDIPEETICLLKELRTKYKIYLLSNTNETHMKEIHRYLSETFDISSFDDIFHKTYYSYIEHLRKPDPKIFHRVLSENNLYPKETLFIDDTLEYINAAKKLGIICHHFLEEDSLQQLIRKYLRES